VIPTRKATDPTGLLNWTRRRHITHDRGYDLIEVLTYLNTSNSRAA